MRACARCSAITLALPGMEVQIAIVNHGIRTSSRPGSSPEGRSLRPSVPAATLEGRLDLREQPFVTIDASSPPATSTTPSTAKEARRQLSAVRRHCRRCALRAPRHAARCRGAGARHLGVLPDRCIPMLPEALSERALLAETRVERLVMVCKAEHRRRRRVRAAPAFHEGVIRSHG